jgi:NAD(P)H-dependent FMN reductase
MDLTIPVILATARENRNSEPVAEFVVDYLRQSSDVSVELVDVRDYLFGQTYESWNEHEDVPEIADWKDTAEDADGFIIVTPEYNHGYPGELKILLDSALEEYFDKPVGLVGVSAGGFGGARVVDHIKPVLTELGMSIMGNAAYVSNVGDKLDESGTITPDAREGLEGQIDDVVKELTRYGQNLKEMRS